MMFPQRFELAFVPRTVAGVAATLMTVMVVWMFAAASAFPVAVG